MELCPARFKLRSTKLGTLSCGTVGRADACTSEIRSSNPVTINSLFEHFCTNCIEKTKMRKKRPGIAVGGYLLIIRVFKGKFQ